ncbi:MAG TPA: metalloregulator ArsR/SmtB family transcription factor [Fimbriiglobus sp.]|jgi:DNA-binding transcriptional ArsR family regulator|nr:metalloregulator ArsR/SmtB family transcription factor [Fimbriiglobus sp.]
MATDEKQRRFYEAMAERFGVLADPTRLAVIHCLMKGDEQNVTSIVGATGCDHSKVSKHLRVLRNAGLVERRKEGLQVFYRLSDPLVEKLCREVCESLMAEFEPDTGDENPC